MKIQGTNPILNAYKQQQLQKQVSKHAPEHKDKIDISQTAKSMQKNHQYEVDRANDVQRIKDQVQSGEYQVDHQKLADKMIQFWKQDRS